ncbi:EVE domain-containing protein [Alloalcanivorax mobilis]|uniref:EVE domain-containing protein n=1 Tax=Alloalcanivorax mobilis TaxID=2019569 RepID=UPI000B5B3C2E|nr:EVE domain-containing protein [Alloalcanivorax mobilis]ASK34015.1 EVE domain-containing protein [Alcanivorax sp. N3-2A]|tara:strand:- start:29664 stop:30164 length:501 start_codon:yes stop_codon:yes gene_type:complete
MRTWLFKTEPRHFSLDDLRDAPDQITGWDGVRNYQARNRLRDEIQEGDRVLIYHSRGKRPAIVGEALVVSRAYPDPTQFNPDHEGFDARSSANQPRWYQIDVRYVRSYTRPLTLNEVRQYPEFADLELVIRPRLSVQNITDRQYQQILALCEPDLSVSGSLDLALP